MLKMLMISLFCVFENEVYHGIPSLSLWHLKTGFQGISLLPSVRRGHSCRELLARDGAGHVDIGAMADLLMNRLPGIAMADDGEATQLSFTIRDLVAGGRDGNGMGTGTVTVAIQILMQC